MKYNGKIKNINHIVVSDPSYEKDVWCRYEKEGIDEKNWLVNLKIEEVEEEIDDFKVSGVEFYMLLKKDKDICEITDNNIRYLSNIKTTKTDIGMDTACIALGVNEKAKEIINSQSKWQPKCAIRTGTDGMFGEVMEGKTEEDLSFILITGYLSEDTGYDIESFFDYLITQFEIIDLVKEKNDKNTNLEERI